MRFLIFGFTLLLLFLTCHMRFVHGEIYFLVWASEFTDLEDFSSEWDDYSLGRRRNAVNVAESRSVGLGFLALKTFKENDRIFSGMIRSKDGFKYGYFEAKIRLHAQEGHWSAFWLQSTEVASGNPPGEAGVEFDIFEYRSIENGKSQSALHWGGYGDAHKTAKIPHENVNFSGGWVVVGGLWTDSGWSVFVDGKEVASFDGPISNVEQFIVLSLEVGSWGGDISKAALPDSMLVDYVRVYKKLGLN